MMFRWVTWEDIGWWIILLGAAIASYVCSGCRAPEYVAVPEVWVNPAPPPPEFRAPAPKDAGTPGPELCCVCMGIMRTVACGPMAWVCSDDGSDELESLAYCGTGACREQETCYLGAAFGGVIVGQVQRCTYLTD